MWVYCDNRKDDQYDERRDSPVSQKGNCFFPVHLPPPSRTYHLRIPTLVSHVFMISKTRPIRRTAAISIRIRTAPNQATINIAKAAARVVDVMMIPVRNAPVSLSLSLPCRFNTLLVSRISLSTE